MSNRRSTDSTRSRWAVPEFRGGDDLGLGASAEVFADEGTVDGVGPCDVVEHPVSKSSEEIGRSHRFGVRRGVVEP